MYNKWNDIRWLTKMLVAPMPKVERETHPTVMIFSDFRKDQ